MHRIPSRFISCLAALAVLATACGTARGFELKRVQRSNVKVLPGSSGFMNPLTGVVSYAPQPWQQRRPLVIKVGNSANERPQSGLDRADVIYEELVEGGVTRFFSVFLTNQSPRVGPVRSVRTVDPLLAEPLGALFAYSGGVPPVVDALRSTSGVTDVGANSANESAYRRDSNRSMPYNLYTSTDALWSGHLGSPPQPQFAFLRSSDDPTKGGEQAATTVKFAFAGNGADISYAYDKTTGRYLRSMSGSPHMVEGNAQLAFRNVLIQTVTVTPGTTIDRAGERSNNIGVIGSGAAVLFRGGRALRGHWSRSSAVDATRFTDTAGKSLKLAVGETIVELLPTAQQLFVS